MDDEGTSKATTSRATWQSAYSMFGPFAIANFIMLIALILFAVFQPKVSDPNTHWALAMVAGVLLVAGGFMVKGILRFKRVHQSHREDQRRIAAGLPLEPEQPED